MTAAKQSRLRQSRQQSSRLRPQRVPKTCSQNQRLNRAPLIHLVHRQNRPRPTRFITFVFPLCLCALVAKLFLTGKTQMKSIRIGAGAGYSIVAGPLQPTEMLELRLPAVSLDRPEVPLPQGSLEPGVERDAGLEPEAGQ